MTPPRRRTHAVSDEAIAALRARLLERASRIVAREGVDGCSLTAVAREAGCSIGMIQHHFQTRDALVLASIEHRSEQALAEWSRLRSASPDPVRALGSLLSFAVEGEETLTDAWGFWLQAYIASPKHPEIRATVTRTLEVWRAMFVDTIAAAREAGRIPRDIEPERTAAHLIAVTDGLAMHALGGFYGTGAADMRRSLLRIAADLLSLEPRDLDPGDLDPGDREKSDREATRDHETTRGRASTEARDREASGEPSPQNRAPQRPLTREDAR
ncbi:TetR/AcrR family transcriptional regulator [Leucobacter ruminantium]|uniref:TetR family transcriptional regulator C-terminal domain-containing protein n=1 Tax=Leucobacter ruminantium TaxID=1289170 RepID=A0A939LZG7_9MICO|nr:TetR family transcriptional regulator C-terminal domain-containing protein [Leucobacter ruminantium]MBO1805277.1 TetR family transcriptional regulator C-terminal domain-containing protein [Leucobacter ruminantium]